ncbi:12-oxophytodienoate reductase [Mycolicibacterium sphagni]|uniref:12-oxophytodienoate reductase n=1 Tax=Mycolicibacterium sphagni TaxID=1786 RepID=A0ABX2JQA3_9MYCO|nr:12-oxophytodienoate reductase [Mycolicibacterium sphagni]NTY58984.1 12-oxophytodienoate reductase [Mycolicibacterium sphagni]
MDDATGGQERSDSGKDTVQDLFTPLTVGSLTVRNRFAMAPMTRAASPDGIPGPDVAAYYARRAAGGTALVITEGIRIPHPAAGWPDRIPNLDGADVLAGWRAVTDAVHAEGGTIAAQLWHQGAARGVHDDDGPDHVPVSPSGVDLAGVAIGRALSTEELPELAQAYALAAANARAAGFDAVEIHGAHGYLLDQFLWEHTNHRTDGYGGSLAARTRFPAEVVAAVRAAVGPDLPIIFRFSQWKMNRYDAQVVGSATELEQLLAPLVEAGVDVLHPSTRRHYVPGFPDEDPRLSLAGWTKKMTGLPVIAVGSVGLETEFNPGEAGGPIPPSSIDRLLDQYEAGEFDIVAVGRALLADPAWVNRVRDGKLDQFGGFDAASALGRLY